MNTSCQIVPPYFLARNYVSLGLLPTKIYYNYIAVVPISIMCDMSTLEDKKQVSYQTLDFVHRALTPEVLDLCTTRRAVHCTGPQ